jgi:TolA-binding protein
MAAERLYMAGKPEATSQLESFIQQYPDGANTVNAHFYLAETYFKEGQTDRSYEHYRYVTQQTKNIFTEPALSKASEMAFRNEEYDIALSMFHRLEEIATNKWNEIKAYTGLMRCYMIKENYQQAMTAAANVKKSDITDVALEKEADFVLGKSNYTLGNLNAAIDPLKDVAKDTKFEAGAEAKYLLAEIYFKQNKKNASEEEIASFIEMGTPYTYWLGKAFLLLAQIYIDNGDIFQAKHTLKSLADNYNVPNDGIIEEALASLKEIEAQEAIQQQNAVDSSFQMEINQN